MGEYTPPFEIPSAGEFLWETYLGISDSFNRISEGVYRLIPPSEWEAWFRLTGRLVYPFEYDILRAMDRVYCEEANKELMDQRARKEEELKQEAEQARQQQGRRRGGR